MRTLRFILIALTLISCSNQPQQKTETSGYIQVDQGKLFYQIVGTGGMPIIVIHGGPDLDQNYLQPQILALAKDHEIIFYDQRGSGKSLETPITPALINLNQFTNDLEALRKQLKLDKVIVLGHSWGGLLAMNYAINYHEHVAGLILLSSAPADYKGFEAFSAAFDQKAGPIQKDIAPLNDDQTFEKLDAAQIEKAYRAMFSIYFYDSQKVAELNLNRSEASAKSGKKVMTVMSQTSWFQPSTNLFPQLSTLQVPTLVIHGKDDLVPLWAAQAIQKTIPHAEIVVIDQSGHFPYIEQPDQTFHAIHRFVDSVEKTHAS